MCLTVICRFMRLDARGHLRLHTCWSGPAPAPGHVQVRFPVVPAEMSAPRWKTRIQYPAVLLKMDFFRDIKDNFFFSFSQNALKHRHPLTP